MSVENEGGKNAGGTGPGRAARAPGRTGSSPGCPCRWRCTRRTCAGEDSCSPTTPGSGPPPRRSRGEPPSQARAPAQTERATTRRDDDPPVESRESNRPRWPVGCDNNEVDVGVFVSCTVRRAAHPCKACDRRCDAPQFPTRSRARPKVRHASAPAPAPSLRAPPSGLASLEI